MWQYVPCVFTAVLYTLITRCRHPGLLHTALGAALGVQAATVRRPCPYPLLEIARASCPTSQRASSSDTAVHATHLGNI
ncbi:hypothetical protein HU200_053977 [Digitaria exilis]|uniref:Uncharacterized protein n=1 Tax=Digitaria exilis TaxID=1010633 RepID=A0A835E5W7_9POAL|nr:hypothetical protein HU200_053977 [Digitaria exilis]